MAAVTICSDFGAQENKVCHCFHYFPIYLPWSDGTRCHDLSFLNVEDWGGVNICPLLGCWWWEKKGTGRAFSNSQKKWAHSPNILLESVLPGYRQSSVPWTEHFSVRFLISELYLIFIKDSGPFKAENSSMWDSGRDVALCIQRTRGCVTRRGTLMWTAEFSYWHQSVLAAHF